MANQGNFKGHERRVAKTFATKRTPFSGGASGITRADTLHKRLFAECKKRAHHAVISLYRETAELAKKEGKIPIISLKEHNTQDLYFIFEENDLFEILKEIDLSLIDPKFSEGTTLYNISMSSKGSTLVTDIIDALKAIINKYGA